MSARTDHWKPTSCDAPDLSSISDSLIGGGVMATLFGSANPNVPPRTQAFCWGYLRLVDLCTFEYARGRESVQEFVDSQATFRFPFLLRAADHFETCVGSLNRAAKYLEQLRRDQHGPQISKHISVLREFERHRKMRDRIQHIDADIWSGDVIAGEPHILQVKQSELALGTEQVGYSELANWIRELHVQAQEIVDLLRP